jgi:DNA-binding SARP family transcriptional activator
MEAAPRNGRFDFRCLGPVTLTGLDGRRLAFRTRKQTALLLLLARRPGHPTARDRLLELLWSEDPPDRARHSLSQSISLINKTLGCEAIAAAGKERVALADGVVRLDASEFESLATRGEHQAARALWRGPLLEGLWVPRAPNFELWLDDERRRLARLMRELLKELIEERRTEGDWKGMRGTAEALLELDALDEPAMLAYLEALALGGDRTLALRRAREFEARLKEELDAEPGPELRAWIKRFRRSDDLQLGTISRVLASRVSEPLVLPSGRPVFGRAAEFANLWEAWESARDGQGRFVILEGPPGIGKTALATKLVNQVHVSGGAVCFVKCFKSEQSVPFAPVSAIIRQLSRQPGFVALGEVWIGELSRLVPELRERFPNAPQPMAIDDSARHRLCDGTLQAAECVADEQPLLVVVDDLQDADEATLALLHYFGRQAAGLPIVLMCVARSSTEATGLQRTFFDTARHGNLARFLVLGALADADIVRIVQQVLAERGLDGPDWALADLAAHAAGNPLHAIEAALAVPERGGMSVEEWHAELRRHVGEGVEPFERTSAERLWSLPDAARLVASALAIAGRSLTEYELAAVTELPPSELASAIFALEGAQFVRRIGANLTFAHEQYLRSAEGLSGEDERRAIHLRLARHLAKSAAANPAARYEVARHYRGAGRLADARAQALAAAKYAGSMGAVREQASALELALEVTEPYDWKVAADLGACYLGLKEFEKLESLCARTRRGSSLSRNTSADFAYLEIAASHDRGQLTLAQVREALARLLDEHQQNFGTRLSALGLLMRTAEKMGDRMEVRMIARDLRRRTRSNSDPNLATHALYASGYVLAKYYWPQKALPLLQRALRQAQAQKNWGLEQQCRAAVGAVFRQCGDYEQSIRESEFGLALARRVLDPQAEANALSDIAVAQIALGNYTEAERRFTEASAILERYPSWPYRAYHLCNQGVLALFKDTLDVARRTYQEAFDSASRIGLWRMAVIASSGLGLCAQRAGDLQGLHAACETTRRLGGRRYKAMNDRAIIEVALAWDLVLNLGRREEAIQELQRAARDLARRDVDHWLRVEEELISIQEYVSAARDSAARARLVGLSKMYKAKAYERWATA